MKYLPIIALCFLVACVPVPETVHPATPSQQVSAAESPTATPLPVRAIQAHPGESYVRLSWSPDGRLVATSGNDAKVKVWDAESLELVHELAHDEMVFSRFTSFSPAGRWLMVSQGWHGESLEGGGQPVYFDVSVWDLETGERMARLTDKATVWNVAWSPAGDLLAYWEAAPEPTIRFWAAPGSGSEAPEPLLLPEIEIGDARWLRDGTLLAAGPVENGLGIWRSTNPEELAVIPGPPVGYAPWITFSPDGSLVAAQDRQGSVTIWDVQAGNLYTHIESKDFYRLADAGLAFSPDNTLLATAVGNEVLVWDLASAGLVARLSSGASALGHLAFSPDGKTLAAGESAGELRLWRLEAHLGPPATPTPLPTNTPVPTLSLLPRLVATQAPATAGPLASSTPELGSETASIYQAVYSPDRSKYAAWVRAGTGDIQDDWLACYDTATNELIFRVPGDQIGSGNEIDWSPDGSRIAVQTFTAIEIFDAATGEHLATLQNVIQHAEGEGYMTVDWSPDGAWIASYLTGYQIGSRVAVWDAQTGQVAHHLLEAADSPIFFEFGLVEHIAWSPDGGRLLMVRSGRVEALDASSGAVQAMPKSQKEISLMGTGAWSFDGVYVAFDAQELYGGPPVVMIWNTETDELLPLLEREPEAQVAHRLPGNLVWAPGKPWLATAGVGGVVYVLDAQVRQALRLQTAAIGAPAVLTWSPDGSRLILSGYNGAAEVWEFPD